MTVELYENLRLELRRGSLVVAVLAALGRERYGYTLRKTLSDRGLEVDENTLYPLLRRLESQGLLVSEWREENKRNKRFYRLSDAGRQMLEQLLMEWRGIQAAVDEILKEDCDGPDEQNSGQTTIQEAVDDGAGVGALSGRG